jgi:hypothetical protein
VRPRHIAKYFAAYNNETEGISRYPPFFINQITIWSSVANTQYYLFGAAQICSTVIG